LSNIAVTASLSHAVGFPSLSRGYQIGIYFFHLLGHEAEVPPFFFEDPDGNKLEICRRESRIIAK